MTQHKEFYMELNYTIELVPDVEQGGWCALHPELPGCMSQGETIEEALANLKDAKELWIESCLESGVPIPPNTGLSPSHELHELHKRLKEVKP